MAVLLVKCKLPIKEKKSKPPSLKYATETRTSYSSNDDTNQTFKSAKLHLFFVLRALKLKNGERLIVLINKCQYFIGNTVSRDYHCSPVFQALRCLSCFSWPVSAWPCWLSHKWRQDLEMLKVSKTPSQNRTTWAKLWCAMQRGKRCQ